MALSIYQVDSFTNKPFSGNPAGVCLLSKPAEDLWMQQVAQEMNVSETAFLYPEKGGYRLRWFSPTVEIKLCGHATLASAHVLWETGQLPSDETARFHTLSGLLTARKKGEWIVLDFPSQPEVPAKEAAADLSRVLGVEPKYVGRNEMDYLVEVDSEPTLRALRPDFQFLATLPVRGLIVTSRATSPGYDFISRFFAPGSGIAEDPATGSSHCCLGPFWSKRLGKDELMAYQASARGGEIRVRTMGLRVELEGQAVTVLRGELLWK